MYVITFSLAVFVFFSIVSFSLKLSPPCNLRRGSKTSGCSTLPAIDPALVTTEPALDTTEPATFPAAEAELAAVSTRVVTAEFRRYQITKRLIALERLVLTRGPKEAAKVSESFGGKGVDDALEQVAGTSSGEDQLGIGGIVFEFGAKT